MRCLILTLSLLVPFYAIQNLHADGPATQPSPPATVPATVPTAPIPYDQYAGYFVSNKFEPDSPQSLVLFSNSADFNNVFGAGVVMHDQSHRLTPDLFDKHLVIAVIKRGPFTHFTVKSVTQSDEALTITYEAISDAPGSATAASPLILSVPKADYKKILFIENGKPAGELQPPSK